MHWLCSPEVEALFISLVKYLIDESWSSPTTFVTFRVLIGSLNIDKREKFLVLNSCSP